MNLLFIYTDEQRADTMEAYGNRRIRVPHLNTLASQSVVFQNAYVTQPVCTASRSSILTGLFPHATGCCENNAPLGEGIRCLPELVSSGKYVAAHIGKWHLGDEIFAQHGFDEWVSIEDDYSKYYSAGRDRNRRSDYLQFLVKNGFPAEPHRDVCARMAEPFTKARFVADRSCDFIRKNKNQPFILYANFLEPHPPFFGPLNNEYDPEEVTLPSNFNAIPTANEHLKKRLIQSGIARNGFGPFRLDNEENWRRVIANYWGLVSLVDRSVGRILKTLNECALGDETLVVFTSDHGDMMGSHGMVVKTVPYEEAVRVPLLMRFPNSRATADVKTRVSLVDLVPTILETLGEEVPDHLHGKSLLPHVQKQKSETVEPVFIEWNGPNGLQGDPQGVGISKEDYLAAMSDPVRTIIQDDWKLSVSPHGLTHELYDLSKDPGECSNQIRDPKLVPLASKMLGRLKTWQQQVGDSVQLPESLTENNPS